jgi:hypothetical protein
MGKKLIRLLKYDVNAVLDNYPELSVKDINGLPKEVYGNFKIKDNEGVLQGDFDISVLIPASYPNGFPQLIETSKKIERIPDRHIDEHGNCCVEITQKIILISKRGIALQDFFKNYVYKFFCWQLVYEAEGRHALKQWDHGALGILGFYVELIGSGDKVVIAKFIKSVLSNRIPGRKDICICGSGKQTRKCHINIFYELYQIGHVQLLNDLKIINTQAL